jgi:dolichyl-phosphate-mannose-protein mannosyltransferase
MTTYRTYRLGLLVIFLVSLGLRFWGLERFNTLVFDEVYYVQFAQKYLTQTPFFDGHPPLSKYLIAIGIWLGNQLPIGQSITNNLTGSQFTTWSYRWLNALTGSFIPIVIAGLVQQLSLNRRFALIAGFLASLDGLFLVESRYALNNVYLVIFGLLGQLCLIVAARSFGPNRWRWRSWLWLCLSGICFAASAAIKWNGLWFLFGAFGCLGLAWGIRWWRKYKRRPPLLIGRDRQHLGRIQPIAAAFFLAILPCFIYSAIWIPHLQQNPKETFWGLHEQIFAYHKNLTAWHAYCSSWNSWLLMFRPVAYFYKIGIDPQQVIPLNAPAIAAPPDAPIYDVHAMGNPILWWASTVAIGNLFLKTIRQLIQPKADRQMMTPPELALASYLLINYTANLLPWMPVTRCIFLYHYMGSSVYAGIALAWWSDRAWDNPDSQNLVKVLLVAVTIGFIFWLPIYLGLPLSPAAYRLRMFLPSWI